MAGSGGWRSAAPPPPRLGRRPRRAREERRAPGCRQAAPTLRYLLQACARPRAASECQPPHPAPQARLGGVHPGLCPQVPEDGTRPLPLQEEHPPRPVRLLHRSEGLRRRPRGRG
eukprot:scaffold83543_cov36-Tisochrysis_lutea.AAC.3